MASVRINTGNWTLEYATKTYPIFFSFFFLKTMNELFLSSTTITHLCFNYNRYLAHILDFNVQFKTIIMRFRVCK